MINVKDRKTFEKKVFRIGKGFGKVTWEIRRKNNKSVEKRCWKGNRWKETE